MAAVSTTPLARVVSRDAAGTPRLMLGASSPEREHLAAAMPFDDVARAELLHHRSALKLSEPTVRQATLDSTHELPGGARVVRFKQQVRGLDVFRARAQVILDKDKELVSLANNLAEAPQSDDQAAPRKQDRFVLQPEAAIARAYQTVARTELEPSAVRALGRETTSFRDYALTTPQSAPRAITAHAKRVYYPDHASLYAAYHVELLLRGPLPVNDNAAFGYVISATDGRVLWQAPLTATDSYNYRVWAEPTGNHTPTDGPLADYTPHPSGKPDGKSPGFIEPILVAVEGMNKHVDGTSDPWLDPGATYTFGNNVHAYSDRDNGVDDAGVAQDDGYDEGDVRADTTSDKTFDRVYDVTKAPNASTDQIKAAVTQIFYVTNWLHDYFYDSGFDEASGNAQARNFGRGGQEGDPLLAEAQDGADHGAGNNANMSTLADGRSPRMQMYVWNGQPNRTLAFEPAITLVDPVGAASFGPQTFDLGADKLPVKVVNDGSTAVPDNTVGAGTGTTSDACQPLTDLGAIIAVIDRGLCPFVDKVKNAQGAGARAVLIVNNAPGHDVVNPSAAGVELDIPVLTLSLEDGQKLKAAITAADIERPVVASKFERGVEVMHDGTIDNTVVAHEWGHYLHHRLVLCGQSSCGGMSEGFGDFNALLLVVKEGDALDNVAFPISQYASAGLDKNASYFGIRRAPYSTSLSINPFTFTHIRRAATLPYGAPLSASSVDMSEAHNVGEIWASLLFEGYTNVIKVGNAAGRPFAESKRRMADYLVAGLKATPVEPTFGEQRDAILSAAWAAAKGDPSRSDDFLALARGFAKRGLGVGAVVPPPESESLNEAVESMSLQGELAVGSLTIDDSVTSCDADGKLDSGESGQATLLIRNTGWTTLQNSRVKLATTDAVVKFDNAGVVQIPELLPFGEATVRFGVSVASGSNNRSLLRVSVNATNPDAFTVSADVPIELLYNYDDVPSVAESDDFESDRSTWSVSPQKVAVWEREGDALNHVWHGADLGTSSDESLVSPLLSVRGDVPLIINFSQRYSFEEGPSPAGTGSVAYDGAVLEVSEDGGSTWRDISSYVNPGYTGTIFAYGDEEEPEPNVLAKRKAWTGKSAGYPAFTRVSLDLGTKLAGQDIKLRFRIGTDGGAGAPGWDIDDISFGTSAVTSLTNTPFSALTSNAKPCAK
jgi:hypothetical protein